MSHTFTLPISSLVIDRHPMPKAISTTLLRPIPGERKVKETASKTAKHNPKARVPAVQQKVILIVEDEETIAETLALIVADVGHVALVAKNGREALTVARERHPQLIITDLMMPLMSGADLIQAVRNDAATEGKPPPPILVVTAVSKRLAEQTGADAVVIKPFDVMKIEAVIRHLLQPDSPSVP